MCLYWCSWRPSNTEISVFGISGPDWAWGLSGQPFSQKVAILAGPPLAACSALAFSAASLLIRPTSLPFATVCLCLPCCPFPPTPVVLGSLVTSLSRFSCSLIPCPLCPVLVLPWPFPGPPIPHLANGHAIRFYVATVSRLPFKYVACTA